MDFLAEQEELNSLNISAITGEEEFFVEEEERFSIPECFQRALTIVNDLVFAKRGKYLSKLEMLIIKGALNDLEYEEITNHSNYTLNYIQRTVAPRLWDILSETIGNGERVGKKRLDYFLEQINNKYHVQSGSREQTSILTNLVAANSQIPDVSKFYGRKKELVHLRELLLHQRCIAILGVAGIGKSTLVAKLVEQVHINPQGFEQVIWKTFNHAPLVEDLVSELINLISPSSLEQKMPEYTQALISLLLKNLQSHRYLIILDSFDYLFSRNNFYQKLEYVTFFRRLIEEEHQSCLILTGRSLPDELEDIIITKRPVQLFKLEGLDPKSAKKFLISKGFKHPEKSEQLIQTYSGNPLELEDAINRISRFFANQEEIFFENPTTLISSRLEGMLNEMFGEMLSSVHKEILIYLAQKMVISSEPIGFTKILNEIKHGQKQSVTTLELIKALEKLERISLIKSAKDPITKEITFTLQPVIKKYIMTDPQGLVHSSHTASDIGSAYGGHNAIAS